MKCVVANVIAGILILSGSWNQAGVLADEPAADKPLAVSTERAFPNLDFDRPIVVTHAGDGSNRVFVAEQKGGIRVFENDQDVEEAALFLDIHDRCVYSDKQNEEGLLGLAFHPNFKQNGEFFVYYTAAESLSETEAAQLSESERDQVKKSNDPKALGFVAGHLSRISRFRVSKDNPNAADPESEEVLLRIPQPFWNHNGGTILFGPDGYLYIGLGDGGSANDPFGNGQNLTTLLGSLLRIDVDHKSDHKNYAIPKDNPFVGRTVPGGPRGTMIPVREETYAYGFRNIWRMSFDAKTGTLWVADVGQNLWEEINIAKPGGNYGWNIRESRHWFRPDGDDAPREDLIDPIHEYHHSVGKSITGGCVYRGTRVPELVGKYVYADYVSTLLWALEYDEKTEKVIANYTLPSNKLPVMSFGEDEKGDVYFTTTFGSLFRFQSGLQE
ncbi:MAG TPA: PQQ-dependent sugar dehydrogenase [Planctomycetaceae bacterium]|nr:PQQ-dependent sugar dehydrogenase [Planctomycetaceae bacterium]HQZ65575.1 PQQ-dependent sugar dehydrogenase [Planctomycetaceae bacterium]